PMPKAMSTLRETPRKGQMTRNMDNTISSSRRTINLAIVLRSTLRYVYPKSLRRSRPHTYSSAQFGSQKIRLTTIYHESGNSSLQGWGRPDTDRDLPHPQYGKTAQSLTSDLGLFNPDIGKEIEAGRVPFKVLHLYVPDRPHVHPPHLDGFDGALRVQQEWGWLQ
ncbi:hypothetical protein LCGC14_0687380, partial [marine sediment metagenome]